MKKIDQNGLIQLCSYGSYKLLNSSALKLSASMNTLENCCGDDPQRRSGGHYSSDINSWRCD
jgi:hypothetical protein